MLDYFFKRPPDSPASGEMAARETLAELPPAHDKELALEQAKALGGDESAAVEFILQCQFADARLIAAQGVCSKDMLERVLPLMRNADRRVAKLMQARLDALEQEQQNVLRAQQCIDQALLLADEPVLLPGQVVDLDHAWQLIASRPSLLQSAFDDARAVLRERLEAQAQLQRAAIDNLARLRELSTRASALAPSEVTAALGHIEQAMAQHLASREAPSLPRNLLSDFSVQREQFKATLSALAQRYDALSARQAALQEWEASQPASLTAEALKRAWLALPALPSDAAAEALQLRFDALLQGMAATRHAQPAAAVKPAGTVNMAAILESMQKALQEGAVRAAVEVDKLLRSPDVQAIRLSPAQTAQLAKMRSELSHLQGWAKWGGNVSRAELLKAAEGVPGMGLAASELAKKVGSLRERWKSLDTSAGAAGKELWERFDAACTLAYAPAAAHFKKLADERQGNVQKAEATIAEVRQFAASHGVGEGAVGTVAANWKAIAAFCTHTSQAWQHLGGIDRKDKKRLDAEFRQSLQLLQQPLAIQQQEEAARREGLIAQVHALNPADRNALDALQERWQQLAKALPLERKLEQALWQKFRAACDTLFAKRKEAASSADAERKRHLAEKEKLCGELEASHVASSQVLVKILRDARDAWSKIGPVPRAMESRIEARFQAATSELHKQIEAAKRAAADKELHALRDKLRLCHALEQALADAQEAAPATAEQWQALPALPTEFERALRARFDRALQAWQSGDGQYHLLLEKNRTPLLQSVLRLEIVAGVESPTELSRERLQMQVAVLQSTLKAGPVLNKQGALLELCKLAALADRQTLGRIEQLIGKLK